MWFFHRFDVVEPAYWRVVWSRAQFLGICLGFLGDTFHGVDKGVQCVFALCFGWLNHHCFVEKQREINRRVMESVVKQTFGHIKRTDVLRISVFSAVFRLQAVEDKLVLAQAVDGEVVVCL